MPRPLPILFIHGFNGDPGDWTDSGFRQYVIEQGDPSASSELALNAVKGQALDPDLVRQFRYGVAEDGTYNNRGDIPQLAARLAGVGLSDKEMLTSSVDRLSADSVARGGPAGVTLIAHSMGGIISRYYLSRREPDRFGAVYRGHVGRLIQIASPNQGVDLMRLTALAPRGSLSWLFIRLLEKLGLAQALPGDAVEAWEAQFQQMQTAERDAVAPPISAPGSRVLLTDTPVYQQLAPGSPLLTELNLPGTMPAHVECHTFYGDIRVRLVVALRPAGRVLLDHAASFGDMLVPAYSAAEIPGAQATPHPYVAERRIELNLRVAASEPRALADLLPDISHAKLLSNRAVQDAVLALLQ
jgi:pimeloyl-ACP methyl ester carboxylesterase